MRDSTARVPVIRALAVETGTRPAQSVDEVLAWSLGCFTQRHIAADGERRQAALRRASRVMNRIEAHQLRQLVEIIQVASESLAHNAALAPGLCGLLGAVKAMPRLRFTGRYATYAEDLGALAGVVAQFLLSPDAALEQAAFEALFALISSTRKDDHRSDPPPRTPTPGSVTALERASVLDAVVASLSRSSALARQAHACELLLMLCRASAPACELASAAGAERAVLAMLQEVGDTSGGWVGGRSLEPPRGPYDFPTSSQDASSSQLHTAVPNLTTRMSIDAIFDDDASVPTRRPYSAYSAVQDSRPRPGPADDSDDETDSPPGTPPSRQRRAQSAAQTRSSAALAQPAARPSARSLAGGGTLPAHGTRQLATGARGRLIFKLVELLSVMLDDAPHAVAPQIASVEGAAALLPLVQAALRAADTKDERRLKNDVLLLLNQLSTCRAGPEALAHGGVLGVLVNGLLASLTPALAAAGGSRALKLCSGFSVEDFDSCQMVLGIFQRCLSCSAACAAAAVGARLDVAMRHLLSPGAWTLRALQGWKADQRALVRLSALRLVREVVGYSDADLLGAAGGDSPRLEAAADVVSLCADEATAAAAGEPAPLLLPALEALAALAADPSGEGAAAARLRSLGAIQMLGALVSPHGAGISPSAASGLALQALTALADADAESTEAMVGGELVARLLLSLAPLADGHDGAAALGLAASDAWNMLQRMGLLAALSSAAEGSRVFDRITRQVAAAAGVPALVELLSTWPPPLLGSGFALLAEWARSPRLLHELMTTTVTVAAGASAGEPHRPVALPALAVLLRLWAHNERSPVYSALAAPSVPRARDAVVALPDAQAPAHLLEPAHDEAGPEVLGKLYALVARADRTAEALPAMEARDGALLTAARAYASVKEGRAWARLASEMEAEGLQPVAADAKRLGEAVEASGRAVGTAWASQREQWGTVARQATHDEMRLYEQALGRVSVVKPLTVAERVIAGMPPQSGPTHEQLQKGKKLKAALLSKSALVVPEGGWVVEDEWRTQTKGFGESANASFLTGAQSRPGSAPGGGEEGLARYVEEALQAMALEGEDTAE